MQKSANNSFMPQFPCLNKIILKKRQNVCIVETSNTIMFICRGLCFLRQQSGKILKINLTLGKCKVRPFLCVALQTAVWNDSNLRKSLDILPTRSSRGTVYLRREKAISSCLSERS